MSILFLELHFVGRVDKNQGSLLEAKGFGEFWLVPKHWYGRDHKCLSQQFNECLSENLTVVPGGWLNSE